MAGLPKIGPKFLGVALGAGAALGLVLVLWLVALPAYQSYGPFAGSEVNVTSPGPATQPGAEGIDELPVFDVVRVSPDGGALVAGRAVSGSEILVMIDGDEAARVRADQTGQFAALFDVTPSPNPRLVTLEMLLSDGTRVEGGESVIMSPVVGSIEVAAAPAVASDPPAPPTAPEEGQAPTVLLATEAGTRVLQSEILPEGITIDAITTDPAGKITVSGRAESVGFARIYADNAEIVTVMIDSNGGWSAPLPVGASPIFMLRVDQLDADGKVVARTETEVSRETREDLAGLLVEEVRAGQTGVVVVTVRPGFTLWAIARDTYGDGRLYVKVFEANRAQIRNPDLIYPGQVFSVPLSDYDPG